MKATNKTIGWLIVSCVLACCLFQSIYAQNAWVLNGTPQSAYFSQTGASADSLEATLQAEINALPKVPPAMVPKSGTFWSLQKCLNGSYPPFPCNPFANQNVEVHALADGTFLLNDLNVSYSAFTNGQNTGGDPSSPPQFSPKAKQFNYAWLNFSLTNIAGVKSGQFLVETKNWGSGWVWGIASKTNLEAYDPRQSSWQLLDPNYYSYDLNGSNYSFSIQPLDKPAEFYKTFNVQDYFQGYWTPIKYLGSNLAANQLVTTNDVVMRFNLVGDIYKFFTNSEKSVEATVIRPSGESVGCFAEISSNGIATIVAPVGNFGTGTNYVWVSFVNEGPQLTNPGPSQPIDMNYLLSLDVPNQEAYLQSINFDVSATGELTNNFPHSFTGYLVFKAAPQIEDTVAAPYVAPYAADESNPTFHRTFKYMGGSNANFTITLMTETNQVITQTNGTAALDANNEYSFEVNLAIPESAVENSGAFVALVQATPNSSGGSNSPASQQIFYAIDKTKFRGYFNVAAWCSMNYQAPSPRPFELLYYGMKEVMDGFMKHAADSVLTAIGQAFQGGFLTAVPDPYVLSLIPAYQYNGSQVAHFSSVLTNSIYAGINFLSHSGAGEDIFNDPALNLSSLSRAAGNLANNNTTRGKGGSGHPVPTYINYKRRMDFWIEASCGGAWRDDAEFFGTPKHIDMALTEMLPTMAFGYDVHDFNPAGGCGHFEQFGELFYGSSVFANTPWRASVALQYANNVQPGAAAVFHPAIQGSLDKTARLNPF